MTCREIVEFLADYLDGSLRETDRAAFEQHLDECPDCVAYLTTFAATPNVLRAAFVESVEPPSLPPELARAVLRALNQHGMAAEHNSP